MAPEEALARMQAQNQALWSKLRSLNRVQEENSDLKTRMAELKDQLVRFWTRSALIVCR